MRASCLWAAVLLVIATGAPALGDSPFEDARSKQEAVAAFADAEKLLVKKVGTTVPCWCRTKRACPKVLDRQRHVGSPVPRSCVSLVQDANGLKGLYESWKTNYNIDYPDTEVRAEARVIRLRPQQADRQRGRQGGRSTPCVAGHS